MYEIVIKIYISNVNDSFKYYYRLLYMTLYSIQWQASHDNWSWYANKPASISIMQINKNLHSMTCNFRKVLRLCLERRNFQGSNFLKSKEFVEVNTIRIFSWPSTLCKVFSYSFEIYRYISFLFRKIRFRFKIRFTNYTIYKPTLPIAYTIGLCLKRSVLHAKL
jgi:hypothetical protein